MRQRKHVRISKKGKRFLAGKTIILASIDLSKIEGKYGYEVDDSNKYSVNFEQHTEGLQDVDNYIYAKYDPKTRILSVEWESNMTDEDATYEDSNRAEYKNVVTNTQARQLIHAFMKENGGL